MKSKNIKIPVFSKSKHRGIVSPSLLTNRFGRRTKLGKFIDRFKRKMHLRKFRRSALSFASLLIILVTIATFLQLNVGATDPEILIDNWTDIPANNIDNLINSIPDELSFGIRTIVDEWCDTYTCDETFVNRKLITVDSDWEDKTDTGVKITVNYSAGMKSDFSDIRFVTKDTKSNNIYIKGYDLNYKLLTKIDNSQAEFNVFFPSLPNGKSQIYMYYGNNSATSTSVSPVKSLYQSYYHNCLIDNNDNAYCWGNGSQGRLGNGSNNNVSTPSSINKSGVLNGLTILSMSLNYNNTCVVASNNNAYCWGDNNEGQLGNNSLIDSSVPIKVDTSNALDGLTILSIYSGSQSTCVIASDHQVYCWGDNSAGQLGIGTNIDSKVPVKVGGVLVGKTIVSLYIQDNSVFVIDSDGNGYSWGGNWSYILGTGSSRPDNSVPQPIDTSGELNGLTIKSISGTNISTCVLASDNNVYCWGNNQDGRLGSGDPVTSSYNYAREVDRSGVLAGLTINSLYSGTGNICVIASDENAYCWGNGDGDNDISNGDEVWGQLGNNGHTDSNIPVAVDRSGVLNGKNIKSMSVGKGSTYNRTCVITTESKLYCWGYNGSADLGNGTTIGTSVPVAVNDSGVLNGKNIESFGQGIISNTTCVLDSDNNAYCWGANDSGRLGNNNVYRYGYNVPVPVDLLVNYINTNISSTFDTTHTINNIEINGSLISEPIEITGSPYFKNVTFGTNPFYDTNKISIQIRTDSVISMTGAPDWLDCNMLSNGASITSSTCFTSGDQYLQYKVFIHSNTISDSIKLNSISFGYINDTTAPTFSDDIITAKKTVSSISDMVEGAWSNANEPYYSWSTATDETDGSGFAGYCLYFGTDSDPDFATTSGRLMGDTSPLNTDDKCQYAITGNSLDFSTLQNFTLDYFYIWKNNQNISMDAVTDGDILNFIVKAIDHNGNLSEDSIQFSYQVDRNGPSTEIPVMGPSAPQNTKAVTMRWLYAPGLVDITDDGSGVAGIKYCAVDALSEDSDAVCSNDESGTGWYGPNHIAGSLNNVGEAGDTWSAEDGMLTTDADNPFMADEGINMVEIAAVDNVGNATVMGSAIVVVSSRSSGAPTNLTAIPEIADSNSFSFEWDYPSIPDGSDDPENPYAGLFEPLFEGSQANMDYCWTVNEEIAVNGSNCHWTARNVLSLPEGPYATKQGPNTLYMMTRNETGNFNATRLWDDDDDPETPDVPLMIDVMWDDDDDPETPNVPLLWDDDNDPETPDVVKQVPKYVATVVFSTSTAAPGIPENIEVIDVSSRLDPIESSIWRLAVSWTRPTVGYESITTYRILRSTTESDNVEDYTEINTVSSDSFSYIDNNLDTNLTYYYKVVACDNAGSCGIASSLSEFSFKKPTGHYTEPATITVQPFVTDISTRKATINWSTNRETEGRIFISNSPGVYTGGDFAKGNPSYTTEHSLSLDNLQAGTRYYFIASWADSGGTAYSDEGSFTTLPAPQITEVDITNITVDGSKVNLKIENASKLSVYYGKTEEFGGVVTINTSMVKSEYSVLLTGLDDGVKYFLRLDGYDLDGNRYPGNIYSFTTLPRPRISNLRFQPVADASSNTTIVTWTTNVPASSELSYGVVGSEQLEAIESKLVLEHEITISNLVDDKNYSLIARSRDASGNLAVSDIQTFRTALDTRPPKISNITVDTTIKGSGSEAKGQVIVSWDTDEPATSQVAYGQGSPGSYSNKTSEDSGLVLSHTVIISDLSTSSIYQIQPLSKDKSDNETKGTNQSAIVGRGSEDVLTIIFNALRNIFGIKA